MIWNVYMYTHLKPSHPWTFARILMLRIHLETQEIKNVGNEECIRDCRIMSPWAWHHRRLAYTFLYYFKEKAAWIQLFFYVLFALHPYFLQDIFHMFNIRVLWFVYVWVLVVSLEFCSILFMQIFKTLNR